MYGGPRAAYGSFIGKVLTFVVVPVAKSITSVGPSSASVVAGVAGDPISSSVSSVSSGIMDFPDKGSVSVPTAFRIGV
jgi:hypothetical protein